MVTSVAPALAQQGAIKEIVVFGNERIDKRIILKEIKSKVGEPFSSEKVREDIKAIYRLGYFRDVQVDVAETKGEIILTFAVIEKPYVANIVISGNSKLKQEEIEGVIEVKRDSVLDMGKVRSSITEVKKLYTSNRYFGSEVEYRVELEQGNKAVVYFDVVEGVKGYLTKIAFVGNKVFGSRKLRSAMKTKEKGWFWWLSGAGKLEKDILELDVNRIRSLYLDQGYVTIKVSEPELTLSKNKKSIKITMRIEEGEQYKLGSLDITGDILTTKEELLKGFKSSVNKVYRSSLIQKDLLWLTDQYTDKGYAYADVAPLTMLDQEKKLVNLTFKIDKGIEVFINRIEIEGNTKTRDKVIRRELKIAEGDLYSSTQIRKSRERVMRTQYFKDVEFAPSPTEKKDLIDLDIRVEEQQTGKLAFGAGYSNVHGVVGSVALSHGNLFGRGYKGNIKVEVGADVLNFNVTLTDPRFLDTPYSVGLTGYSETEEYDTYAVDLAGAGIIIGREITENIVASLGYRFERVRIHDVFSTPGNAEVPGTNPSPPPLTGDDPTWPGYKYAQPPGGYQPGDYIYDNQGTSTTGKVTLMLTRNTLNDPYFPTKGSNIWVSGTVAGLGGNNFFYSLSGGASWFHPIVGDLVLNLRATAGTLQRYTSTPVPTNERFYVGGINNLRGFEYGYAGPLGTTTVYTGHDTESPPNGLIDHSDASGRANSDPIGATNMVVGNVELLYPLSKALGLRAAVFFDVGKGWGGGETKFDNSFWPLRYAAGAGIRWYSPFGPIRVDWGFNLSPQADRGEKSNVWDFSMGTMF
ncbi:MAG: outer membrane protein assembly factor BamA [Deltaproteobacteria bacterium]|nr:outer membrane protein assembly factor BamA [Deltaproteobacteria bacterium]